MISPLLPLLTSALFAFSVRTPTGEIILSNVPLGSIYSLETHARQSYRLQNTSDAPIDASITIAVPNKKDHLVSGYEPLPNADWVRVTQERARLAPAEEIKTDLLFKVPMDAKYSGKKFQAFVWAKSAPSGQTTTISAGLKSRLLINLASTTSRKTESITTSPESIKLENFPKGNQIDLREKYETFAFTNTTAKTVFMHLTALPANASFAKITEKTSIGNTDWLTLPGKIYRVKPNQTFEFPIKIKIPTNAVKDTYAFAIESIVTGLGEPIVSLSDLCISTN